MSKIPEKILTKNLPRRHKNKNSPSGHVLHVLSHLSCCHSFGHRFSNFVTIVTLVMFITLVTLAMFVSLVTFVAFEWSHLSHSVTFTIFCHICKVLPGFVKFVTFCYNLTGFVTFVMFCHILSHLSHFVMFCHVFSP